MSSIPAYQELDIELRYSRYCRMSQKMVIYAKTASGDVTRLTFDATSRTFEQHKCDDWRCPEYNAYWTTFEDGVQGHEYRRLHRDQLHYPLMCLAVSWSSRVEGVMNVFCDRDGYISTYAFSPDRQGHFEKKQSLNMRVVVNAPPRRWDHCLDDKRLDYRGSGWCEQIQETVFFMRDIVTHLIEQYIFSVARHQFEKIDLPEVEMTKTYKRGKKGTIIMLCQSLVTNTPILLFTDRLGHVKKRWFVRNRTFEDITYESPIRNLTTLTAQEIRWHKEQERQIGKLCMNGIYLEEHGYEMWPFDDHSVAEVNGNIRLYEATWRREPSNETTTPTTPTPIVPVTTSDLIPLQVRYSYCLGSDVFSATNSITGKTHVFVWNEAEDQLEETAWCERCDRPGIRKWDDDQYSTIRKRWIDDRDELGREQPVFLQKSESTCRMVSIVKKNGRLEIVGSLVKQPSSVKMLNREYDSMAFWKSTRRYWLSELSILELFHSDAQNCSIFRAKVHAEKRIASFKVDWYHLDFEEVRYETNPMKNGRQTEVDLFLSTIPAESLLQFLSIAQQLDSPATRDMVMTLAHRIRKVGHDRVEEMRDEFEDDVPDDSFRKWMSEMARYRKGVYGLRRDALLYQLDKYVAGADLEKTTSDDLLFFEAFLGRRLPILRAYNMLTCKDECFQLCGEVIHEVPALDEAMIQLNEYPYLLSSDKFAYRIADGGFLSIESPTSSEKSQRLRVFMMHEQEDEMSRLVEEMGSFELSKCAEEDGPVNAEPDVSTDEERDEDDRLRMDSPSSDDDDSFCFAGGSEDEEPRQEPQDAPATVQQEPAPTCSIC